MDGAAELVVQGPFLLGLDFDDAADTWSNLPRGLFRVLEQAGVSLSGPFGSDKQLRFREAILRLGDRVAVCGRAAVQVAVTGARDQLRGPPLRRSIHGSSREPVAITDADDDV